MNLKFFYTLIFAGLFIGQAVAQGPVALKVATDEEFTEDLRSVPCKNSDRLEAVKKFFLKMGAAENEISTERIKDVQNVVITKKGKTDETVIIGAHYDKVSDGCGAIDNWTGVVILGHLYRTLRGTDSEKTYVFIAFDKEETGLVGSSVFAKSIPKEKRVSYCAMVNLDSFGFTYPQVFKDISNSKMTKAAEDLAAELKMPPLNVFSIEGASSDSASFNDKDIPAITFSALSNNWKNYLHSSNDKLEHINVSSVRVGYHFLLRYVAKIESSACGVFRKEK